MEFNEVIKERYACKSFSNKEVPDEIVTRILEAGRLAPTALNTQEHHIYVFKSEKALKLMDEFNPCRYGAPVVLCVTYDSNKEYTYFDGVTKSGMEDATIVATHMMLAAKNEGVDSCWINYFEIEKLAKEMNLPENEKILMLLDLGYPSEKGGPLPNHSKRKDIKETVTWL